MQHLEGIFIHWTRQIQEVVAGDDSSVSDDADPIAELGFWQMRQKDLVGLLQQLKTKGDPRSMSSCVCSDSVPLC